MYAKPKKSKIVHYCTSLQANARPSLPSPVEVLSVQVSRSLVTEPGAFSSQVPAQWPSTCAVERVHLV